MEMFFLWPVAATAEVPSCHLTNRYTRYKMVHCQYLYLCHFPSVAVTRIVKLHLHFDVKAESSKLVKASWVAQPSMWHVTPFQEVWIVWKMCVLVHCSAENLLFYLTKAHNAQHHTILRDTTLLSNCRYLSIYQLSLDTYWYCSARFRPSLWHSLSVQPYVYCVPIQWPPSTRQ